MEHTDHGVAKRSPWWKELMASRGQNGCAPIGLEPVPPRGAPGPLPRANQTAWIGTMILAFYLSTPMLREGGELARGHTAGTCCVQDSDPDLSDSYCVSSLD